MEIKITKREISIILAALTGAKFDDYMTEKEKEILLSRLIDEKRKTEE